MKAKQEGNGRLEEALVTLIQNQAQFVGQMSRMDERFARMEERFARMDERFARIETKLTQIEQILIHHQRTLDALPEAIREKIGFQGRQ